MFASVLIANRGEIACRIIRSARAMGMRTIAVYSEPDRKAMHVEMADEAFALGGARPEESYLRPEAILEAARASGAECIHPGYGFLAENSAFAEACAMEGIAFVGPPVAAIRAMGRKDEAKALMRKAGVPVLPGYEGSLAAAEDLLAAVRDISLPVMVKAVAGGGGTGMRRVETEAELPDAIEAVRREAKAAFGDANIIVEKCLEAPRHIEVQILADAHGECIHLFERDCSLQRRRQKVIEEAPAPGMPAGLREKMTTAAVSAARAVGYSGAGTVEFLVADTVLSEESPFYFLEMNTRLQVEHPVTEAITGLDLVERQFRVAAGEPLGIAQEDVSLDGHAVEARIYCEDPKRGFLPSSGKLHLVRWPEGGNVRVDAGVRTGDAVSPFYDSMVAKIIAHGADRETAIGRLSDALRCTAIAGPKSNLCFLHDLLTRDDVKAGRVDTALIERNMPLEEEKPPSAAAVRAGLSALLDARTERSAARRTNEDAVAHSPWDARDGFTLGEPRATALDIVVNGEAVRALVKFDASGISISLPDLDEADMAPEHLQPVISGDRVFVLSDLEQLEITIGGTGQERGRGEAASGAVHAPMHGRIAALQVKAGDEVAAGAPLAILEAMKMEHRLTAPRAGKVLTIEVGEGDQVSEGALIATVGEEDA